MEILSWTGSVGHFLDPIFFTLAFVVIAVGLVNFIRSFGIGELRDELHWKNYILPGILVAIFLVLASFSTTQSLVAFAGNLGFSGFLGWLFALAIAFIPGLVITWICFQFSASDLQSVLRALTLLFIITCLIYLVLGAILPRDSLGIVGNISKRLIPTWIALILTFYFSIRYKRRLGFYGKLFDNTVGMIGFGLVMFWVFTAIFGGLFGWIITHDIFSQVSGMKNKVPGTPLSDEALYPYYLLGGDNAARDVFSRVVVGAWVVIQIAPLATIFAFMVGITLGLPAGYFGKRYDTVTSFIANLVLAFPVILLFYLLVTPEIQNGPIPVWMAGFLFIFPIIFLVVLFNSRYFTKPKTRNILVGTVVILGGWIYLSALSKPDSPVNFMPQSLDLFDIDSGILIVFVSVVFVNAPTVFRIVRGLTMDVKARDYVGAAQTRGERPWYIMLWEILPNVRGPLIVDFCLRIGYVTILLGTLGFFGLGLEFSSPDWGSTINAGRKLLSVYPHPALPPAVALMTLVLGLNLLADGLREESLKD